MKRDEEGENNGVGRLHRAPQGKLTSPEVALQLAGCWLKRL